MTTWREKRVDHAMLEDQMCSYTGVPGEESPDVLDAMIYGITELMLPNEPTADDHLDSMKRRLAKMQGGKQP